MVDEKAEVSKEEVKEVKEVKKPERYELTEIVTQTGIAVKDNDTEKVFTQEELLVEILNKLNKVEKAVA